MSDSKKELIFNKLEEILGNIQAGSKPSETSSYIYTNSVSYVDRQYMNFEQSDVEAHPKPWIILNNIGEFMKPYPSKVFENTVLVEIVGFVELTGETQNLDSLMNSLQKDILVAILSDTELSGLCDYLVPRNVMTVEELINPYGGFALKLEITYKTTGLNF